MMLVFLCVICNIFGCDSTTTGRRCLSLAREDSQSQAGCWQHLSYTPDTYNERVHCWHLSLLASHFHPRSEEVVCAKAGVHAVVWHEYYCSPSAKLEENRLFFSVVHAPMCSHSSLLHECEYLTLYPPFANAFAPIMNCTVYTQSKSVTNSINNGFSPSHVRLSQACSVTTLHTNRTTI